VARLNAIVDPEKTPHKSKFKARTLLKRWYTQLTQKESESSTKNEELSKQVGIVSFLLGANHVDTDEIAAGETYLNKAIEKLSDTSTQHANELIDANNRLGLVWMKRSDYTKALQFLTNAHEIFKKANSSDAPSLEKSHTTTLFSLSQVHARLKQDDIAAKFSHEALNQQLQRKQPPHDWSQNCIDLAVLYINQKKFRQGAYCLDAAESMLKYSNSKENEFETVKANLARARGTYYLRCLQFSAQALVQEKKTPILTATATADAAPAATSATSTTSTSTPTEEKLVLFHAMNLAPPKPFNLATSFEQAKELFKKGLAAYNEAIEYYVLDGFVNEHTAIMQDISALYKVLTLFETDPSRKCKMHKRRIHKLEPLLDDIELSQYPTFYQQLTDELAHTYGDLVELKHTIRKYEDRRASISTSKKINDLAKKAINFYSNYLKTFDVQGKEPETLDPMHQKQYLSNMQAIARLHSKYFSMDPVAVCNALNKSIEQYKKVIETAKKFNATCFDEELAVCKEMLQSLPLKIDKITTTKTPFIE